MAQLDGEALTARCIVMEMLLATIIIELSRHRTADVESIRRIMLPVEDQLLALRKEAAEGKETLAAAAHEYFEAFSTAVLANVPHHGKH